jgi:D-amino peptidase
MKLLIAVDMEGITGVVHWDQVTPGLPDYPRFRQLMTADVNAAIEGAFEAGADEIIVTDGHEQGLNILIEELDPRARLNSGNNTALAMVQGADQGIDGALFVGYHARAGSAHAVLDHTWSSRIVVDVMLNERGVGEIGLNAAVCGHYGAPVLMVSGDQTACGEARDLLGSIEVAVIKQAVAHMSAECLPPEISQEKICEAAARAVARLRAGDAPAPFYPAEPVRVTIEFVNSAMADGASLLPGASREGGRLVIFTAPDMPAAYRGFHSAVELARG